MTITYHPHQPTRSTYWLRDEDGRVLGTFRTRTEAEDVAALALDV
jgi:predicted acetyltransferase